MHANPESVRHVGRKPSDQPYHLSDQPRGVEREYLPAFAIYYIFVVR